MIDAAKLATWDRRRTYEEFTWRLELLPKFVGQLYPGIVRDELEQIAEYSIRTFRYHPNWIPELEKRERAAAERTA